MTNVAVVGSGYWGKNLVRNFHELGALAAVCDTREDVRESVEAAYGVKTFESFDSLLDDAGIDAVVIAAPAAQHYALARKALLAGKDVYAEKPLALHADEGRKLVELARQRQRILMVGHILEYHPAVLELKRRIDTGELGKIQYISSSRLNLGKLRTEENILWSFAPHDISAILFLLGESPSRISCQGGSYLNPPILDTTFTTCEFQSGVKAHFFVSWLHPFKEQKLVVVGDCKMAVFDDTSADKKLMLYSHRIKWLDRVPVADKDAGEVVELPKLEPLRQECAHFLECVETRQMPRTSGESAVRVLEVLECCERSLKEGRPAEVSTMLLPFFAHPTAVIDEGCEIGEGTHIWHFSHIMSNSSIGANCNLGQNVVVSPKVRIGNNVKVQNNVSIYTGVELEDNVFCGPSMVFTNVNNPRSHVSRKHEYRRTLVKEGASIGANATVVCGATLGRYCFIGAGAVVTHDVADYAIMVGVPAEQVGWMCYCGVRLDGSSGEIGCAECGRRYFLDAGVCTELTRDKVAAEPIPIPVRIAA
jgi:UDP-2-acetamido-3-amino-2,3-dideoxy-glucuronate N-acetyltransferase